MSIQLEAVYENGVFHPLQPIQLREQQRVIVTIDEESDTDVGAIRAHFVLSSENWQAFCDALDAPPKILPNLKKLLTEANLFDGDGTDAS